jgi:hypothetical protein
MIHDTKKRNRISGKRKRIPPDPNLQQGFPNKKEEVLIPGDLYQKRQDDIDPNTINQNRITARREEELQEKLLPKAGKE